MSFRSILFVGAVTMGILAITPSAFTHDDSNAGLIYRLNLEGVKTPVDWFRRQDLECLVEETVKRATEIDSSCKLEQLFELHLIQENQKFLAGYETFVYCDDTPNPAIAFYFDSKSQFLGSLVFGN